MVKEYRKYKYIYNSLMPITYGLYVGMLVWVIFVAGTNISVLMAGVAFLWLIVFSYIFKVDTFLHICILLYLYVLSLQQMICYTFPDIFTSMGQYWYVSKDEIQNFSTCMKYNFLLELAFVIMILTEIFVMHYLKIVRIQKIIPLGEYVFKFNPFVLSISFSVLETVIILNKRAMGSGVGILRLSNIGFVYYLFKSVGLLFAAYSINYISRKKYSIAKLFLIALIYGAPYLIGGSKLDFLVCFMAIILFEILSNRINVKDIINLKTVLILMLTLLILVFCMQMRNGVEDKYGVWNLLNRVTGYLDGCKCLEYVYKHGNAGGFLSYVSAVVGKGESISQIYTTYIFEKKISGHAFATPSFIAAYMYGGLGGVIVSSVCITCILCTFERTINLMGQKDTEACFMFSILYVMVYIVCIWEGQIENWKALVGPILVYMIIVLMVKVRFVPNDNLWLRFRKEKQGNNSLFQ